MILKIVIENFSKKHKTFKLFEHSAQDCMEAVIQVGQRQHKIEYNKIVDQFAVQPSIAYVFKSTNNRQLNFYTINMFQGKVYFEPQFEIINGMAFGNVIQLRQRIKSNEPHEEWKYKRKWNPKKWNIADTKEYFLTAANKFLIEVRLKPLQKFEISFYLKKQSRDERLELAKQAALFFNKNIKP